MTQTGLPRFWRRTQRLTAGLLGLWLLVVVFAPWGARALDRQHLFGFPLGYWLVAQGSLILFLAIVLVFAVRMDRIEADCHQPALPEATPGAPPAPR